MRSILSKRMKAFLPTLSAQARWGWNLLGSLIVVLTLCSATARACEGPELEYTLQIIQSLQQEGAIMVYQCGMSENPNPLACAIQAIMAIDAKYSPLINALSPSCQLLIQSVGNASGGGGGGGETHCMGGHCCDSTGCY